MKKLRLLSLFIALVCALSARAQVVSPIVGGAGGGAGSSSPSSSIGPNMQYWYLMPQSIGCGTMPNCTAIYGDTRTITDGTSNSTTTFTCPNADCNFTAADVGKIFWATTAGSTDALTTAGNYTTFVCPQTTIQTVNSTSNITLANACTASGTANVYAYWGHSDGATLHALDGGSDCRTLNVFSGAQIMIDQAFFITPPTGCSGGNGHPGQRDWWTGATSLTIYLTPNFNYATCTGAGGSFLGNTVCMGSGIFQFYNTQITGSGLTSASNSNCANASGKTILALNPIAGALYEVDMNGVCPGEPGNGIVMNSFDENWVEGGVQSSMVKSCVFASSATNSSNLDCINDFVTGGFGTWVTNNAIANDFATYPHANSQIDAGSILQTHGSTFFGMTSGIYALQVNGNHISDGDQIICTVSGSGCVNLANGAVQSSRSTTWTSTGATSCIVVVGGGKFIDQGGNTCTGGGNVIGSGGTPAAQFSGVQTLSTGCTGTATSSTTIGLYPIGENTTLNCTSTTTTLGAMMTRSGTGLGLNAFATHAGVNASSGVVTVTKNGSNTTLTCTIGTGTGCRDTTHTFSYAVGDVISFTVTTQASEVLAGVNVTLEVW